MFMRFGGHHLQLVAEQRLLIGQRVGAQAGLGGRQAVGFGQQGAAADSERVLIRPQMVDNFHAGVPAVAVDAQQPSAGGQGFGQGPDDGAHLVFGGGAGPVGLGGDHQVVGGLIGVGPGQGAAQNELPVLPVNDMHHRGDVDRVAGAGTGFHPPILGHLLVNVPQLAGELQGGGTPQGGAPPGHLRFAGGGAQAGGFGVGHIGDDEHHLRVLVQAIRQAVQGLADVLQADLLAHDQPRDMGETFVEHPHDVGEHGGVPHSGVEHPQGVRAGGDALRLPGYPRRHLLLLGGGGDEHHIGGPAVEKPGARPVGRWCGH